MRKQLLGSLVGGIILFLWQFLSWTVLNVHGSEMQATPNQDAILQTLSQNLQEGQYFLPQWPEKSPEEQRAAMESSAGKPWATISYHPSMNTGMGLNMVRGLAADLVAAFLLTWLLLRFAQLDMRTAVLAALAVGGTGYLTIAYLNSVWFEGHTIGQLIDTVVQWGLVGVWLGWWLRR